ncbi:hypothetical protein RHAL1_00896 [Beijerinckiaceae bacterium RH AL1]|nr:hypothetical protein RHAL8_00870 [Beijerinckiaceae bacterium RH AL8]VVB43787.1 hypothetical protein RHCH11_RHCH11_00871 [Beijerinckiaceae bacterium RH CH11]VVC54003.1 hypothetical protein RHAL1_00896 [Beijerinckiaceae bacterium RH AL1]
MSVVRQNALVVAALAWGAAAVVYVAGEALAAAAYTPAYSYAENYISDLGVPACGIVFAGRAVCSPLHAVMNGDFVLQGVLFFVGGLAAARALSGVGRWPLAACAALNAIGISLVGLFPETSGVAGVHGLGAFLAIVFGNATGFVSAFAFRELRLPTAHRVASLALPVLGLAALAVLIAAREHGPLLVPDGVWERASVYTITAWEAVTAVFLLRRPATARGNDGVIPPA